MPVGKVKLVTSLILVSSYPTVVKILVSLFFQSKAAVASYEVAVEVAQLSAAASQQPVMTTLRVEMRFGEPADSIFWRST